MREKLCAGARPRWRPQRWRSRNLPALLHLQRLDAEIISSLRSENSSTFPGRTRGSSGGGAAGRRRRQRSVPLKDVHASQPGRFSFLTAGRERSCFFSGRRGKLSVPIKVPGPNLHLPPECVTRKRSQRANVQRRIRRPPPMCHAGEQSIVGKK